MRVYANVDMWDDEGMGFRVHSVQGDTVSLKNIDVEIRAVSKRQGYFSVYVYDVLRDGSSCGCPCE